MVNLQKIWIPFIFTAIIVFLLFTITIKPKKYSTASTEWYFNISKSVRNVSFTPTLRICCIILSTPKYFTTRTKAIENTWAPRCDEHFYVSEPLEDDATEEVKNFAKTLPIAPISDILPGYDHLTQKSVYGLSYAYEQYNNVCDWYIKADDDTYLLMHNLRTFLSRENASMPITFGYNFKVNLMNLI